MPALIKIALRLQTIGLIWFICQKIPRGSAAAGVKRLQPSEQLLLRLGKREPMAAGLVQVMPVFSDVQETRPGRYRLAIGQRHCPRDRPPCRRRRRVAPAGPATRRQRRGPSRDRNRRGLWWIWGVISVMSQRASAYSPVEDHALKMLPEGDWKAEVDPVPPRGWQAGRARATSWSMGLLREPMLSANELPQVFEDLLAPRQARGCARSTSRAKKLAPIGAASSLKS